MRSRPEAIALLIFISMLRPAVADDAAKAIVERAIKVTAPKEELLKKQTTMVMKMEGKVYFEKDVAYPATRETFSIWPTHFRLNVEMERPEGKASLAMVLEGDQGWQRLAGLLSEMTFAGVDEFKSEIFGRWMATLYPLRDSAFTLTLLKDAKVGDEEVSVVKAAMRLRPEVNLYFSKKSGHLLKIQYVAKEAGIDRRKEHVFSDYKEIEGLMLPTKMIDYVQTGSRPNEKKSEWTITTYQFPDKLPPDTFDQPGKKK